MLHVTTLHTYHIGSKPRSRTNRKNATELGGHSVQSSLFRSHPFDWHLKRLYRLSIVIIGLVVQWRALVWLVTPGYWSLHTFHIWNRQKIRKKNNSKPKLKERKTFKNNWRVIIVAYSMDYAPFELLLVVRARARSRCLDVSRLCR